MSPFKAVPATILAASLLLPATAHAQTANGGPIAPVPPGLAGPQRPASHVAPSAGPRRAAPGATLPEGGAKPSRPTAAERAEQKKLEHDLHICIGC